MAKPKKTRPESKRCGQPAAIQGELFDTTAEAGAEVLNGNYEKFDIGTQNSRTPPSALRPRIALLTRVLDRAFCQGRGEFIDGNVQFAELLLDTLYEHQLVIDQLGHQCMTSLQKGDANVQ